MNSVMKHTKKEDAVSPVVGVMLMLVVTIVIAAIVAAFATGMFSDTQAAGNAIITLEDCEMGTVDTASTAPDHAYTKGYVNFGKDGSGNDRSNYAPYSMTFKHKGGDQLDVNTLKLVITYNGATYTTAFKEVTTAPNFVAGDTLKLAINPTTATKENQLLYGLSKQSMFTLTEPNSFVWEIQDGSNKAIAKGTVNIQRIKVAPSP